jgi:hypothetical protein
VCVCVGEGLILLKEYGHLGCMTAEFGGTYRHLKREEQMSNRPGEAIRKLGSVQTAQHCNSEDPALHCHCCENLNFEIL